MAEYDYLVFKGDKVYLDTNTIDAMANQAGGAFMKGYENFITGDGEGNEHLDEKLLKDALTASGEVRRVSDKILSASAKKYSREAPYKLSIDGAPRLQRLPDGSLKPFRLMHENLNCSYSYYGVKLQFPTNGAIDGFLSEQNMKLLYLLPCPHCCQTAMPSEIKNSVEYTVKHGYPIPEEKAFELKMSLSRKEHLIKEKKHARTHTSVSNGLKALIWCGATMLVAFVLALLMSLGVLGGVLHSAEVLFSYVCGIIPAMLKGIFWPPDIYAYGKTVLFSADPATTLQGFAFMSLAVTFAARTFAEVLYFSLGEKHWRAPFGSYVVAIFCALVSAVVFFFVPPVALIYFLFKDTSRIAQLLAVKIYAAHDFRLRLN